MTSDIFDAIVIGAGSGGSAFAKRAASHGARVAVVEGADFGGTCVNVGCVPKKIMWWASQVQEFVENAHEYGIHANKSERVDWKYLKSRRDASVQRLRRIYEEGLLKNGVTCFKGFGSFHEVAAAVSEEPTSEPPTWRINVTGSEGKCEVIAGTHVVIATGSESTKLNIPGEKECTGTSDYLFTMEELPQKIAVVGAGYIAVEFAGVLQGLGADTSLFIRGDTVLRKFDSLISTTVTKNLELQGVKLHRRCQFKRFSQDANGRYIHLGEQTESKCGPFDVVIVAVGRSPKLASLRLDNLKPSIEMLPSGGIRVDDFQNTSLPRLYAIGDIIQKVELTPMAIAAGRRLADRLFLRGFSQARANYENVPSVIFSHPPVGSVGMSEETARAKFGSKVLVYTNTAVNLYYNVFDRAPECKPRTFVKVICMMAGADEIVVGVHVIGMGADEMIQGFGFAIGLSKAQLDSVVAVHPSAAEEIVTCHPWGLPHMENNILRPLTTSIGEESEVKDQISIPE